MRGELEMVVHKLEAAETQQHRLRQAVGAGVQQAHAAAFLQRQSPEVGRVRHLGHRRQARPQLRRVQPVLTHPLTQRPTTYSNHYRTYSVLCAL